MKAMLLTGAGKPLVLETVRDPVAGPGEAVVRLRAAALNRRDLYICRGQYADLRFPIIPGSDGMGEVAAVGPGVAGVSVGAQVVINPSLDWGDDPRVPGPKWRILGLPDDAGVGLTTGCQMAHFTCLAAARHRALAEVGWDVETDGLFGAPPIRVLVGARAHTTVFAALRDSSR